MNVPSYMSMGICQYPVPILNLLKFSFNQNSSLLETPVGLHAEPKSFINIHYFPSTNEKLSFLGE